MLRDIKAARNALSEDPPMPARHRSVLTALLSARHDAARRGAGCCPAARTADRAAAVLSGRQDEGRAAEDAACPVHRPVPQDRFFHRPPRRGNAISRAQPGILYRGRPHGRRHHRMRRNVYKGPRTGLPAFAMRPAHHHQHPVGAGAGRKMHASLQPGRRRHRQEGVGKVLHLRHHARGIQDADREDGRLQSRREDAGGISERHAALAHRSLRQLRHADDP